MISALVLAAGTSSRMLSANKLLLPFGGRTSLRIVTENLLASGVEDVIVVTGHQSESVQDRLNDLPVRFVYNEGFAEGMTGSIQKGVAAAVGDGYMICLADMPLITANDYAALREGFEKQKRIDHACICVPAFEGKRGNPVCFSAAYRQAILRQPAGDGCRNLLQLNKAHVYTVDAMTAGIFQDIDTPEAYEQALTALVNRTKM